MDRWGHFPGIRMPGEPTPGNCGCALTRAIHADAIVLFGTSPSASRKGLVGAARTEVLTARTMIICQS